MPFCIVRPGLDSVVRCCPYVLPFGALAAGACNRRAPERASTGGAGPPSPSTGPASASSLAGVRRVAVWVRVLSAPWRGRDSTARLRTAPVAFARSLDVIPPGTRGAVSAFADWLIVVDP
jgi:hypothetical protein